MLRHCSHHRSQWKAKMSTSPNGDERQEEVVQEAASKVATCAPVAGTQNTLWKIAASSQWCVMRARSAST